MDSVQTEEMLYFSLKVQGWMGKPWTIKMEDLDINLCATMHQCNFHQASPAFMIFLFLIYKIKLYYLPSRVFVKIKKK